MKYLVILFSILAYSVALADICSSPVDRVQLTRSGNVEVISTGLFGNGDGRTVCNINSEWKDVGVETCKGWYSLLLTSMAQGSSVKIQYDNGVACTETGAWASAPAPWMLSND